MIRFEKVFLVDGVRHHHGDGNKELGGKSFDMKNCHKLVISHFHSQKALKAPPVAPNTTFYSLLFSFFSQNEEKKEFSLQEIVKKYAMHFEVEY